MKNKSKYIVILGLSMVLYTSCKRELLTPIPQTSVADVSAFSTPFRISSQVLSLYATLKSGSFYGGRAVIYGDIRGEDFINITSNLVTSYDVWNLNPTNSATAVTGLWGQAFTTIDACNV